MYKLKSESDCAPFFRKFIAFPPQNYRRVQGVPLGGHDVASHAEHPLALGACSRDKNNPDQVGEELELLLEILRIYFIDNKTVPKFCHVRC